MHKHDDDGRLNTESGRLDVYVVTAGEPVAAGFWFEQRDIAEQLSEALLPLITKWIRRIAFVELSWPDLPDPQEGKRRPKVTKRFAPRVMA